VDWKAEYIQLYLAHVAHKTVSAAVFLWD